jgi:hypothetical protein
MNNNKISQALVERIKARADQEAYSRKLSVTADGYVLLMPVVQKWREMGLSTKDIGRMFTFLGTEVFIEDPGRPKSK